MKMLVVLLFLAIFSLTFSPKGYSQNIVETDSLISNEKIATEGSSVSSISANYELKYPGMLPDNPFYFLKVIRDGILKMIINDDMKRAKFSLENAEKRMFAGKLLIDKGKDGLAVTTIGKSNNYANDAIKAINKYHKSHPNSTDVKPFLSQMDAVLLKHREIMMQEKKNLDKSFINQYLQEQKRLEDIEKTVKKLLLE